MRGIACGAARAAAALVAMLVFACGGGNRESTLGDFVLHADLLGTTVSTLSVMVTAADIPTPLAFNITQQNGVARSPGRRGSQR